MRRTLIVLLIAAILATAASSDADAPQEAEERLPTASDAYTFDSPVRDMKWVKDEKGKPTIVLLQTSEGYVHKSVDSGRNWQSLGDLFKPNAVALTAKPKGLLGHAKIKTAGKEHLIQKMYAPSNLRSIYFRPFTCFAVLCCSPCGQVFVTGRQRSGILHLLLWNNARDNRSLQHVLHEDNSCP